MWPVAAATDQDVERMNDHLLVFLNPRPVAFCTMFRLPSLPRQGAHKECKFQYSWDVIREANLMPVSILTPKIRTAHTTLLAKVNSVAAALGQTSVKENGHLCFKRCFRNITCSHPHLWYTTIPRPVYSKNSISSPYRRVSQLQFLKPLFSPKRELTDFAHQNHYTRQKVQIPDLCRLHHYPPFAITLQSDLVWKANYFALHALVHHCHPP